MAGEVKLSSLRVTADMDSAGYARGAAAIDDANRRLAASGQLVGATMAAQDAAVGRTGGTIIALSKTYVDGYGATARFAKQVSQLQTQFELGNVAPEKAAAIYQGLSGKFGLYADATKAAAAGNRDFAAVLDAVNAKAAVQIGAMNKLEVAQRSYSAGAINQRLGIGQGTLSASDSAQVFISKFAEENAAVARMKAAQVGAAFSDELQARLIAGTAKSARESATVFEAEFDRLADIARLKAQQIGQNFTQDFNASLRINTTPKSAQESASVFEGASRDARAIDDLRARYDPLYAAQRNYLTALKDIKAAGSDAFGGQERYAQAITRTKDAFAQQIVYIQRSSQDTEKFGRNISGIVTNLGFQVNDIVTGVLLGQSPFMIMAQQGGQVLQILGQSPVGIGGLLGQMKDKLLGLVTVGRLAFGGIAGAIFLAYNALTRYQSAQRDVERQLSGVGRASGASASDIDKIGLASATPYGFSESEARGVAAALASTGKIGLEALQPLVAMGHDFAKTFGVTVPEAAQLLAKSFSDPVRGATELNERLGFLSDATKRLIESQVAQGNRQQAINTLMDAVRPKLADAADVTGFWTRQWNALSNGISNAFDRLGRYFDRLSGGAGGRSINQQIADDTVELLDLQRQMMEASRRGTSSQDEMGNTVNLYSGLGAKIDALTAKLDALRKKQADANAAGEDARLNQRSLEIGNYVTAMVPGVEVTRKATDATIALNAAMDDPALQKRLAYVDQLSVAYNRWLAAQKASAGADPIKNQIAGMEAQVRGLDNRSPAERRRLAIEAERRAQSLDTAAGNEDERLRKQKLAGDIAAGGQTALDNIQRQRIGTLGQLASVEDVVRSKELELNNMARDGVRFTDAQRQAILDLARTQEEASRLQDRVTAGVATEVQIRAQLQREMQSLIDRKVVDASSTEQLAQAYEVLAKRLEQTRDAAMIARAPFEGLKRLELESGNLRTQLDKFGTETSSSLGNAFVDIGMHAKSTGDVFKELGQSFERSALQMVANMTIVRVQAMLLQMVFSALGFGGGGFGGIGGGVGRDPMGVAVGHTGGMGSELTGRRYVHPAHFENAPRFHNGKMPWDPSYEMGAIIRKDEGVFTPGQIRAMGGAGGKAAPVNVGITFEDHSGGVVAEQTGEERNGSDIKLRFKLRKIMQEDYATGHYDNVMGARYALGRPKVLRAGAQP